MSFEYSSTSVYRAELSELAEQAGERMEGMIGRKVAPPLGREKDEGVFPILDIATGKLLRAKETERRPHGTYGEIKRYWKNRQYLLKDYGIREPIDDNDQRKYENIIDLEETSVKLTAESLERAYEKRVADLWMTEGTWKVGTTNSVTNPEGNYTDGNTDFDPIKDFKTVNRNLTNYGYKPNIAIMSGEVFDFLSRQAAIIDYLYPRGGSSSLQRPVMADDLARIMKVDKVLIGESTLDTSTTATTVTISQVWSNSYIWFGRVAGGSHANGGAARTLTWDKVKPGGRRNGSESNGMFSTRTYRVDERKTNYIETSAYYQVVVVDPAAGWLLKTNFGS